MIRIEHHEEALFELYQSSIKVEDDALDEAPVSRYEQHSLGSVRELKFLDKLILFVLMSKTAKGSYLCVKASSFTEFAVSTDVILAGLGGDYLFDPSNTFILQAEEIAASVELFGLELLDFMELESKLEMGEHAFKDAFKDISLDSFKARFRIQEYELSLPFKSRKPASPHQLWIPQLAFDFGLLKEKQNSFAAKGQDLETAFGMLKQSANAKVFYTLTHSLKLLDSGQIILIPESKYCQLYCDVYCGAFKVFSGYMPKEFLLGSRMPFSLVELQEILDIRIEPR